MKKFLEKSILKNINIEKLNKNKLIAKQLSSREGTLYCEYLNDRVIIGGEAVTVLSGELII